MTLRLVRALLPCGLLAALATGCAREPDGAAPEGPRYASAFRLVELDPEAPAPLKLAVQACAGLDNRRLGGSVYVRTGPNDDAWLAELGLAPAATVQGPAFLAECVARYPACVRYDYAGQQRLVPNVLTVAAALEALPLDASLAGGCARTAYDATVEFADRQTPELATRHVFEAFGAQTTGLAMLNPGYDQRARDQSRPELASDAPSFLVDLVFARKLFVVFLVNACLGGHPENALLTEIVNAGRWPTPLPVLGYNNSWLVGGGYLYEAHTRCLDTRNMGAIPTEAYSLSFFSTRRPPVERAGELPPVAPARPAYDPQKTYAAFVVGDGDNVAYVLAARREWLLQRRRACAEPGRACPPLTWSLSPHLPRLAPDVLHWYYRTARETGRDAFALPPSGHLYAYPSSMPPDEQARFAAATEEDARLLGVTGVVHWDFFDGWRYAEERFLPQYARQGGPIRGVFPVNVPYTRPTFTWWEPDRFFKVLAGADGGRAVVFRPRSWRGVDGRDGEFFVTPAKMAEELGAHPRGTVTWVYMTSDGGLTLENSFEQLAALLPPHVELVTADAAAELGLASGRD
jgi:hypothetical protein